MQIMRERKGKQRYLMSEEGYGMAHYFEDTCSVSVMRCAYLNTLQDMMCPCEEEEEEACAIFDENIRFVQGARGGESEAERKENLVRAIWENETHNRGIPRFTLEQVTEFVGDLTLGTFGWVLPEYCPYDIFSNEPDDTTMVYEFLTGKNIKRVVSALKFYKVKHENPHLTPILQHIFERLDYRWNKDSQRIHISYKSSLNTEYQWVFSKLGYELHKEIPANRKDVLAQYIKIERTQSMTQASLV